MPIVLSRLTVLSMVFVLLLSTFCTFFAALLDTTIHKPLFSYLGTSLQFLTVLMLVWYNSSRPSAVISEQTMIERMQREKRCFDTDHLGRNDSTGFEHLIRSPYPDMGYHLKRAIFGHSAIEGGRPIARTTDIMPQEQVMAAASPSPSKTLASEKEERLSEFSVSDTNDDDSMIFTPPPSESDVSSTPRNTTIKTTIKERLKKARREKNQHVATEFSRGYERKDARLVLEEAELRYESKPKYSAARAAALILLEEARSACTKLEYLKKRKVVALKRIDLEIDYLEKMGKKWESEEEMKR